MRSDDPRLVRLRALIGKLERLPASTQRERALSEVRARIVDVETGEVPRVMRPIEEPEAGSLAVPAASEGDAKRRRTPATARRERAQAARRPVVAPAVPPGPPVVAPAVPPGPPARAQVPADPGSPSLGSDGLLWLEDQVTDDSEPGDGPDAAPWRRGLRG